MIKILISWFIPLIISIVFFLYVITPSSYFNFLPYQIHESLFQNDKHEMEFIIAFDFIVAVLIFFVFHKLLKKIALFYNKREM